MRSTLALGVLLATALPAVAADPWHLAGWNARAVVEVGKVSPDAGCDVCGVKILCQGRAKADGSDYRVTDAAGKALPFQLAFHDAATYSLVSFQATNAKAKYFVYFDNPKATRAPEQVVENAAIGTGPPKGAWVPKFGFVLQTIERPKGDNPRTVAEMAKLIADSKAKHGARYQRRVADGYNAFGSSDYYISIYKGWVRVPKAGKYQFCTVSNEASFSFLDGKELVHWPGRHTTDRGARGEVNVLVDLKEGLQYLEYYHEEVTLEQMAYLGWRPSADDGPFSPIPETFYTAPHDGVVKVYDGPKGPIPAFESTVADSMWPAERGEVQYTHVTFQVAPGMPAGTAFTWDFGDGMTGSGAKVDHLYLTLGPQAVTLTTTSGTVKQPVAVFELELVTDLFKEGRPKDYLKMVKDYDRTKLAAPALRELAYLYAEAEDAAGALAVGREYVKRFEKTSDALNLARVRRLMADCSIQLGEVGLDEAIENYKAALVKEVPANERLEVIGRLVRLVGVERNQPEKALAVFAEADKLVKAEGVDADGRKALRKAVQAAGDVRLWQGKRTEAQKLYARSEAMLPRAIPSQVRIARIGAYPNSLREYIAAGNYGAAIDLVDQWDDQFATDKLNGQSFFWRGKALALRGQPREAARHLDLAVRLTTGAAFETEARWLLAETLETLGKKEEARKHLAKLISLGLKDEFVTKAVEKLRKK
jgi:tetratricopeptide (TPR) repeat protein